MYGRTLRQLGGMTLAIISMAWAPAPALAQEACTLPSSIEAPDPRTPDYRNTDKPTDYLALVLSWSPQHCEQQRNKPKEQRRKHEFQCFSENRFEWVVHGLWPQNGKAVSNQDHPRHCQTSASLPVPLVRQHLCMMPGTDLMQNEWQAHGTCAWNSAEAYFADIQKVYAKLRRPTTAEMIGSPSTVKPNQLVDLKAADIKQSFLKLNPSLSAGNLRVTVASGNRLKEVWLCLTKALEPMACPTGGTPDHQVIRVRTPHR